MVFFFFFHATLTTEIYTLSLHDALPIWPGGRRPVVAGRADGRRQAARGAGQFLDALFRLRHRVVGLLRPVLRRPGRSEEHTSELQSHSDLVCRLLLEKKKKKTNSCSLPQ